MIGGPIGWPIGGIIPSGSEIFDQEVSASLAATVTLRRLVRPTIMVAAAVGPDIVRAVSFRLQAAVDAAAIVRKSVAKYLSASASAGASVLKQAGKLVSAAVIAAASLVTGLGFFRTITANVGTTVSQAHAIAKTMPVLSHAAVSVRKAITRTLSPAGVTASGRVFKRAGKVLAAGVVASVTMDNIKARTIDLIVSVAASVGISRRTGFAMVASVGAGVEVIKQAGKLLSAGVRGAATILATFIQFFRPRRVVASIRAGRGRGSIKAGSARTRIGD